MDTAGRRRHLVGPHPGVAAAASLVVVAGAPGLLLARRTGEMARVSAPAAAAAPAAALAVAPVTGALAARIRVLAPAYCAESLLGDDELLALCPGVAKDRAGASPSRATCSSPGCGQLRRASGGSAE